MRMFSRVQRARKYEREPQNLTFPRQKVWRTKTTAQKCSPECFHQTNKLYWSKRVFRGTTEELWEVDAGGLVKCSRSKQNCTFPFWKDQPCDQAENRGRDGKEERNKKGKWREMEKVPSPTTYRMETLALHEIDSGYSKCWANCMSGCGEMGTEIISKYLHLLVPITCTLGWHVVSAKS